MTAADLSVFTAHGGRLDAARAAFGDGAWIDLSTGIAPWAWPAGSVDPAWSRLPEPGALAALEAAAAAAFGVADAAQVVAVPGSDLALRLLARIVPAARPAVLRPGYAGHAAAWPHARALVAGDVPAADVAHDLLVLASPANPDGRATSRALLRRLAKDMTIVVDEAYADPAPGLARHAGDRLIVLRSFGKFYGLPGVRLGFVVAGATVAAPLRALLGDWPLSSAAIAIGTAAYRDAAWRLAQRARIVAAGGALDAILAAAGCIVVGRAALFRLIAPDDAAALFHRLARHAILTRPFADAPDRLRLGLPPDAAAMARLAAALKEDVR